MKRSERQDANSQGTSLSNKQFSFNEAESEMVDKDIDELMRATSQNFTERFMIKNNKDTKIVKPIVQSHQVKVIGNRFTNVNRDKECTTTNASANVLHHKNYKAFIPYINKEIQNQSQESSTKQSQNNE